GSQEKRAMTEERQQVRELARQFAESELRPHVEQWDRDRRLDPGVLEQLAELGFFGMRVPEEYGGMGFDLGMYVAVLEELAWGEPSVALTVSIHSAFAVGLLLAHGTEAQKREWLGRLASGEVIGCFALSEAGAGSDAAAVETRAWRDGDGWVLSGEKKWVTNARLAGLGLVVARTAEDPAGGEQPKSRGLSVFLVPMDSPGVEIGERKTTMGLRPIEVGDVRFRDVRVPGDALLGEEGRGFALAMEALDVGRLGIAAQAVGIAQAALEHARSYADEREQFGRKLREFEGIQFKLADMATRVAAARALLEAASAEPSTSRSAMAKLFASETAMWVTTQAVQ